VQAKSIDNIVNKTIAENSPNLKKEMPLQVQEASTTPSRHNQNRTSPWHIIKTITTENKEKNIEDCKEKSQITYKGKSIKIIADLSTETLKARKAWSEVFQALKANYFSLRILYPAKLSFKIDRRIKVFHYKQKPNYHYRRFRKESYTQKTKTNITTK
jgi:TPP-dependent 2-oxoacid decarboxylase